jgi:hypothetical protein
MKTHLQNLFLVLAIWLAAPLLHAQGTAFTYQGQLQNNGSPASGSYDLTFTLFGSSTNGVAIAGPVTNSATAVSNGLFTTTIDFGSGVFTGGSNWLEIAVRTNGAGNFTKLAPRQQVTPAPYAIMAENVSGGALAAGTYSNAVTLNNSTNSFNGSYSGNGGGLTNLNAANISSGTLADAQLSGNVAFLNSSPTFAGDITMSGGAAYHYLALSGGNSLGFLYGSYPFYGDGIHLGYNFYADASGTGHVINSGGPTSRITAGYGAISLAIGGVNGFPYNIVDVTASGVTVDYGTLTLNGGGGINMYGGVRSKYYTGSTGWWSGCSSANDFLFTYNNNNTAYIDTGGSYHQVSDLRLKRDITNLDGALDRLLQLRPVSYHMRNVPGAPLSLGLIAQEVEPLFPEVVGHQQNGMKDLAYSGLVPVTIRAIQELNQKLETQAKQKDTEIQGLKQSNDMLVEQLNELQAAVKALQEKK